MSPFSYSADSITKDRPLAQSTHVGFSLTFQSELLQEESTQKLGLESQWNLFLPILEVFVVVGRRPQVVGLRDPSRKARFELTRGFPPILCYESAL